MNEPVYFLKLELENVRCFGEKAELDLSDGNGNWRQWTVILGDNGTGKTTLLQIVSLFELKESSGPDGFTKGYRPRIEYVNLFYYNPLIKSFSFDKEEKMEMTLSRDLDREGKIKSNVLEITSKKEKFFQISAASLDDKPDIKVFGYGASRFIGKRSSEVTTENYEGLFYDDPTLINAEEWLLNLDYAASRDSHLKEFAKKRKLLVEETLLALLPDIREIRFTTPTKEKLVPGLEFLTPYGNWVTIHQLSLGYKTMVAWMVDLAARMFARYPESNNPLAEPAIVLVDEIDLHLHPKWQRKIFGYLSERFPKTQFVVTAHSPLVVQSAPKDANIVVLRKEGDHVVIDNDVQSVHNWRLDQILSSDLFGIESSRGPETEQWLDERKKLLQKEILSSEEKKRLAILNDKASALPTADNEKDIAAMELIRKAAKYIETQNMPLTQ